MTDTAKVVRRTLQPKWICMVVRSGYHNGSYCQSDEPHRAWDCGWYFSYTSKAYGPDDRFVIEVTHA